MENNILINIKGYILRVGGEYKESTDKQVAFLLGRIDTDRDMAIDRLTMFKWSEKHYTAIIEALGDIQDIDYPDQEIGKCSDDYKESLGAMNKAKSWKGRKGGKVSFIQHRANKYK